MLAIVGLGNPGRSYEETRHNVGFRVLDVLAGRLRTGFRPAKGEYVAATGSYRDDEIILAKPVTYMNESGVAVAGLVDQQRILLHQLLIVVDDFQIPLGSVRLRPSGSDGGHNGLASVIYHLQSDEFARLRCGIGSDTMPQDKTLMADFVLSKFLPEERPVVDDMIVHAADACLSLAADGLAKTMSLFNRKGEGKVDE